MNLPNKLTMLRMVMIPLFLVCLFLLSDPWNYLLALVLFIAASLTDLLDGRIARSRGLVTDFGKLMDPLADKLLVMSAMVSYVYLGWVHAVVVIFILAREFLVTAIRQIAASKGTVLAADKWGKLKTVSQMIWICFYLLGCWLGSTFDMPGFYIVLFGWTGWILTAVVVFLTLFSGFNYLKNNWDLFRDA